jgi:5-formyltetrahydrofolate cyclo-ligase
MTPVGQVKQAIRERVWSRLELAGAVEPGVAGYIPDFQGTDQAAGRLAGLSVWKQADVIQVVPDRAQLPVRLRALQAGKLLYMAVPGLAGAEPFYLLDPHRLAVDPAAAADREIAARVASQVGPDKMQPIDLIVCGSVAVNRHGARLGKGAGYSDIEVALLAEAGLIGEHTTIATTVHELQVLDEELPEQGQDFRIDLIATPERVIRCGAARRLPRLNWEILSEEQIASIPVLARKARQLRSR